MKYILVLGKMYKNCSTVIFKLALLQTLRYVPTNFIELKYYGAKIFITGNIIHFHNYIEFIDKSFVELQVSRLQSDVKRYFRLLNHNSG